MENKNKPFNESYAYNDKIKSNANNSYKRINPKTPNPNPNYVPPAFIKKEEK